MAYVNIPASTGNISINVPSSQGRININTASKNDTTNVSLQDVQSFAVNKAKDWAEKMDGPIGSEGYSAKWHATEASKSATEAQEYAKQAEELEASIDTVVSNATTEINAIKDSVLQDENIVAIKDNLSNITTTAVNIEDININAENIEAIKDTAVLIEHIEKKSIPVGTIYQAIRTDIPEGSLRLDGTEFTTGFEGFVTNYLATGKIISKSFDEWQTEYTMTNGNVGFFGYDETTGKFKTPCIQAGTFLAQAVASGEFGSFLASSLKSHTHSWSGTTSSNGAHTHTRGTMDITGTIYYARDNVQAINGSLITGFAVNQSAEGNQAGVTGSQSCLRSGNANFKASKGWTGETSSNGAHTHTVSGTTGGTGGSDTYPKHIRYPFFVVVSNVTAEEPSQADWDNFVGNLDGKANKSLNNLDEQGEKHFLNKQQITNCLLEVPQRIKLELNSESSLVLKAGSEYIVPNGKNTDGSLKFDYVTTDIDIQQGNGHATQDLYFVRNYSLPKYLMGYHATKCFSGNTAPTGFGTYAFWYDTANNLVKWTQDSGATWTSGYSLPVCLTTGSSNTVISSIDQVFNGFGYIGSTFWVDKGVKALLPNGRNEDGSLKNIEWVNNKVLTADEAVWGTRTDGKIVMTSVFGGGIYFQNAERFANQGNIRHNYNEVDNLWYYSDNAGASWSPEQLLILADNVNMANGNIISFQPKQPFRAVDYSDSSTVSGWAMPSRKNINLTIGANGTKYTSPANGWFYLSGGVSSPNDWAALICYSRNYAIGSGGGGYQFLLPVAAGTVISLEYSSGATSLKLSFIYAEGEVA